MSETKFIVLFFILLFSSFSHAQVAATIEPLEEGKTPNNSKTLKKAFLYMGFN